MPNPDTNTTDATRGSSLRARVTARKEELERAFATLAPDDRGRRDVEGALNEVSGLLTGDLDHIPRVVAMELNNWLEANKHINEWTRTAVDAPTVAHPARQLCSYNDLVAFLVETNVTHRANPASFTVQIATQPPALPGVAFVRWVEKVPLVQVMQEIVTSVPEDRIRDVEIAISRINDEAIMPGYGFSYEERFVYYRLSVPIHNGGISSDVLQRSVSAVLDNALQLEPALKKIVDGAAGASVLDSVSLGLHPGVL